MLGGCLARVCKDLAWAAYSVLVSHTRHPYTLPTFWNQGGINDFWIKAKLRIMLRPLLERLPVLGAVQVRALL